MVKKGFSWIHIIWYSIVVRAGLYQNFATLLNIVQNYTLEIIYEKNKFYSTQLLYSDKMLDVRALHILNICKFINKLN